MESKEKVKELLNNLDKIGGIGLSVAEQGIIAFSKMQLKKILESVEKFENSIKDKNWDQSIVSLIGTVEKVNILYAYLMQPSVLSSLMSSKVGEIAESSLDVLTDLMGEAITTMKRNLKEMGLETLSVSMNSSPPTFNISLSIKSQ
ncbi:hypothetical protein GWK48_04070 [Metallosphaera tengchongensis]|uniref:Uncharacterized protein n=1 Tax=Metallosphaera tengchongensis TaxID=1532350 RepID=A0A6N0NU72_9CREN|nr:hypothetical protein [Metallosphaera tengchongensis]QKQ99676.1 hypothetical protein GWK48_04070 [Metallosphaera tengchongensis]